MHWRHAHGVLEIGEKPVLMGILNVTPDSFSDGGSFLHPDAALEAAEKMAVAGAVILDVGGESTRPGAQPVSADEELRRVIPVILKIREKLPGILISIDTYKGPVAREAMQAGAAIVNDVSGGSWDVELTGVVAGSKAGYVVMHSRGRPDGMQNNPVYGDVAVEVFQHLTTFRDRLAALGVEGERLVFDPGIGFGKTAEHNMELIRSEFWAGLERPVLWGISRKSFISKILGVDQNDRLTGALALHARLLNQSCPQIWRVHEVAEYSRFMEMWFRLEKS